MEKRNVYSIFDVKASCYGNIFASSTDGLALRVFEQIVQFGGNPDYQRYPEDFALYCIGEFLDTTGDLTPCRARLVTTALSVLQQSRGAAVGGESPLKQQSAENADSADAVNDSKPACDVESETIQSEAEVKNA